MTTATPANIPSNAGLFIALEGGEGSGKSTQARLLAEWLRDAGHAVATAREPGSTLLGERIRTTVLRSSDLDIPARSEMFLMLAARAAFVDLVVQPALKAGAVVIADRYELSTIAYQGAGRGLHIPMVEQANAVATGGLRPDLTILLNVNAATGKNRQAAARKSADRIEPEGSDFHERVAEGFLRAAKNRPDVALLDASGTIGEVHADIQHLVAPKLRHVIVR